METDEDSRKMTECDEISMRQLVITLKMVMKGILEFNSTLAAFLEEQKKLARELWTLVIRYNAINSKPQISHPPTIIVKEEILEELIVKIQEKTTCIHLALQSLRNQYDQLPKHKELLQNHSDQVQWNPVSRSTFALKGNLNHRSLSQCLEEIADILFQYDISITCMSQYFDSLSLHDSNSYQNLLNAFSLPKEHTDFVKEFQINCSMIFN